MHYDENPRRLLRDGDFLMTRLWSMARGSGFAPGTLPDPGGTMDQAAIMLDAFGVMSSAAAELNPKQQD